MCLASDPPNRPELSRGTCEVWDGERWTLQSTVTVLTAASGFESLLDVQIFCAKEAKILQERLNGTLKRSLSLLGDAEPRSRLANGQLQLDQIISDMDQQLKHLLELRASEQSSSSSKSGGVSDVGTDVMQHAEQPPPPAGPATGSPSMQDAGKGSRKGQGSMSHHRSGVGHNHGYLRAGNHPVQSTHYHTQSPTSANNNNNNASGGKSPHSNIHKTLSDAGNVSTVPTTESGVDGDEIDKEESDYDEDDDDCEIAGDPVGSEGVLVYRSVVGESTGSDRRCGSGSLGLGLGSAAAVVVEVNQRIEIVKHRHVATAVGASRLKANVKSIAALASAVGMPMPILTPDAATPPLPLPSTTTNAKGTASQTQTNTKGKSR